jgi:Flp pilus assembly pilin Flp
MLKRFLQDECGAVGIEYALIGTLIGLVLIGSITSIGTQTGDSLNTVSNEF